MDEKVVKYTEDFLSLRSDLNTINDLFLLKNKSIYINPPKIPQAPKKKYKCATLEYKKKYLELFFKSKLNPALFCRLHKINYRNFKNWLKIVS